MIPFDNYIDKFVELTFIGGEVVSGPLRQDFVEIDGREEPHYWLDCHSHVVEFNKDHVITLTLRTGK